MKIRNLTTRQRVLAVSVGVAALFVLVLRFGPGQPTTSVPTRVDGGAAVTTDVAVGGPPSGPGQQATPGRSAASSSTAPHDDEHGDGTDDTAPVLVQPTSNPPVQEAATQFTAAWLNTYGQTAESWRASLTERVTDDLAADLAAADPGTVPAGAKTGPVDVTVQGSLYGADAPIVTNDAARKPLGTLHLTLVQRAGAWLVSEIDWEPRR